MGSKRTRATTSKYFILFVCVQVVIANYILQHNPYQKLVLVVCRASCTW